MYLCSERSASVQMWRRVCMVWTGAVVAGVLRTLAHATVCVNRLEAVVVVACLTQTTSWMSLVSSSVAGPLMSAKASWCCLWIQASKVKVRAMRIICTAMASGRSGATAAGRADMLAASSSLEEVLNWLLGRITIVCSDVVRCRAFLVLFFLAVVGTLRCHSSKRPKKVKKAQNIAPVCVWRVQHR